MKILCVSDTHGELTNLKQLINLEENIDFLLHAGDRMADVEFLQERSFNIVTVKGNLDQKARGNWEEIINITDKKILLTHGHKYRVKYGLNNLSYRAKELGVEIVIFGHTHRSCKVEQDDILYLNPGSLSYPRDGSVSYGLIKIKGKEIKAKIKSI